MAVDWNSPAPKADAGSKGTGGAPVMSPAERQRDVSSRYLVKDSAELRRSRAPRRKRSVLSLASALCAVPVVLLVVFGAASLLILATSSAHASLGELVSAFGGALPAGVQGLMSPDLFATLNMLAGSVQLLRLVSVPFAVASLACSALSFLRRTASGGSVFGLLAFGVWLVVSVAPAFLPSL